jgi:tetratricopeptide (TPR) repeat protein/capsular polysaccharide biosynthesis protein
VQLRLYELHYNLGHVLHQQGNLMDAVESYRQTIALNPNYVNAYHSLGVTMDEQGQPAAAIAYYRQAIALDPIYVNAYNNLGCALAKLDRLEEAVCVYQQAIAIQPGWAILHNNLGQALFESDPAAAIAAYREAIRLQPSLTIAHYNLGKAWQLTGQYRAAIACFEQAIGSNGVGLDLELDLETGLAAISHCGESWLALKDWQQAIAYFQRAIAPQSELIQAFCASTDYLLAEAELAESDRLLQAKIACGRLLQALLAGSPFAEIMPWLTRTLLYQADALMLYGGKAQQRQAERYYQQALQLQPADQVLHLRLIDCLIRQERLSAATFACHTAIALDDQQAQLYLQLGYIQEQRQQWETAIEYYRQAFRCQAQSGLGAIGLESQPANRKAGKRLSVDWLTVQEWLSTAKLSRYSLQDSLPAEPIAPSLDAVPPSACGGLNCTPCLKRIFQQFNLTHLGHDRYTCNRAPNFPAPPSFTVTVPNGKAWAMAQQNSWQVCGAIAILTPEDRLLAEVSRDYPGQLPGCQQHDPANHRIFSEALPDPEQIPGTVAAIANLSGHNYFHWMVDVLPRLELLHRSGGSGQAIDWLWINSVQQSFQRETLQALGIPASKILSSDRHPYIQAQQLVVPSFAGHLGWLEPWALRFLRDTFLPMGQQVAGQTRDRPLDRIYISRAGANHRRVLNEAEVMQQLEPLGFVSVVLETLSFAEQVALFAQAKAIVAPHGGGLTNLLFCQPETVVIELASPHYLRHYFWAISQPLQLQHFLLTGEAIACEPMRRLMYPSPLTEDIWVKLDSLRSLLHRLDLR